MTTTSTVKHKPNSRLILASGSPRRKQLLGDLGLGFDIIPSDYDESDHPYQGISEDYCCELAHLKGGTVSLRFPQSIIIGADTIVVLGDEVMGKPADKWEAHAMLEKLSGNTHQVYTGVSIQQKSSGLDHLFYERTDVTFNQLSVEEISYYVDNFPPYDKAGSYGIQDWSVIFVEKIKGCYNNVVGFPVFRFYKEVKALGIPLDFHHN